MEVIPAIDLLDGSCVRLLKGDFNHVSKFNNDPVEQARKWEEQGAERIHLVDLDAAKTGKHKNDKAIKDVVKAVNIPVQIGGGIRNYERASMLLEYGIESVIIGTSAIENPNLVESITTNYKNRVIVGIDVKNGKVATRGWVEESNVQASELVNRFNKSNLKGFIFTDISTDGTLEGPNIKALRELAQFTEVPLIASGGIGSMQDLLSILKLEEEGVTGVILGRALYDEKIDLKEAIQTIGHKQINDLTNKSSFLA